MYVIIYYNMKYKGNLIWEQIQQNNPIDQKPSFACIKSTTVQAHLYLFFKKMSWLNFYPAISDIQL